MMANEVIDHLGRLNITPEEFTLVMCVYRDWIDKTEFPQMRIPKIAKMVGCNEKTIRTWADSLEFKGYLKRSHGHQKIVIWDFSGLINAAIDADKTAKLKRQDSSELKIKKPTLKAPPKRKNSSSVNNFSKRQDSSELKEFNSEESGSSKRQDSSELKNPPPITPPCTARPSVEDCRSTPTSEVGTGEGEAQIDADEDRETGTPKIPRQNPETKTGNPFTDGSHYHAYFTQLLGTWRKYRGIRPHSITKERAKQWQKLCDDTDIEDLLHVANEVLQEDRDLNETPQIKTINLVIKALVEDLHRYPAKL